MPNASHKSVAQTHAEAEIEGFRKALGPFVVAAESTGMAIERGLAHELEGTVHVDYLAAGIVCTIDIPVPLGPVDG